MQTSTPAAHPVMGPVGVYVMDQSDDFWMKLQSSLGSSQAWL